MEPAVTPELALRYLRELSADLVAAAVLGAGGERLAGSRALARAAVELLARAHGAPLAEGRVEGHLVVLARSREHAVVAIHTPWALPSLVRHDVVTVLGDLAAGPPGGATADAAPRRIEDGEPALGRVLRAALAAGDPAPGDPSRMGPDRG